MDLKMPLKYSIEYMKELAIHRQGKCLSDRYINYNTNLLWECKNGHTWSSAPDTVVHCNSWCPKCASLNRRRYTIEEVQDIISKRKGKILSPSIETTNVKYRWECSNGHVWEAVLSSVIYLNTWCPYCSGYRKTMDDVYKLAKTRGLICLSTTYINGVDELKWQCGNGHKWKANYRQVRSGKGCPHCSWNITEEKCRHIFECIVKKNFPRNRKIIPNKLELDGYCDIEKIAFEYNGQQHYKPIRVFNKCRSLAEIQKADEAKKIACEQLGILLIIIPYYVFKNDAELIGFIKKCLPNKFQNKNVSMKNFYNRLSSLRDLSESAKTKGGKLISNVYYGVNRKLKWECEHGHTWRSPPILIRQGSWCPYCNGNVRLDIKEAQRLAQKRGGECISKRYFNNRRKLKWRCTLGHVWSASLDNIKIRNSWCPKCSGLQKLTIQEMKKIAELKDGRCLSKEYVNSVSKLRWQCNCGYIWESTPSHIKQGTWCPKCSGQISPSISDLNKIAQNKGGCLLSKIYMNAHTKLQWKCKNNHEWWASPTNIKTGKWCPYCSGRLKSCET